MKRMVLLITASLMICTAGPVFAEGEETDPSSVETGQVRYLENEPDPDVENIWYMYLDTKDRDYGWDFPYSDSFFRTDPGLFSMQTARGSLGLALSAFKSSSGLLDPQYRTYLTKAGFTDLYAFGYDSPSTEDSLSGVIGMKKIDDFTVIAAVTCGQGYGNEWAGNLKVGDGVRHEGFSNAAALLESHIDQYISDNKIEGKKKLWLAGMSRAAAVANLTAADMTERGDFDDIYAYLFGVPRTTREPVAYKGIYNICGQYDPVAATPFQSWGYERYGVDLYTPAEESDKDYEGYKAAAIEAGDRMGGDGFRNNPEVNYQLRLFMEGLDEFFDSSAEYTERLQPLILKALKEKNENEDMISIISEALKRLPPKDERERNERSVMLDYLSYVVAQHMRASQRQIDYGDWNPDEALEANLVIEHRPSTYVKWLFSTDDAQHLFSTGTESRRVTVIGDVDVAVFRNGKGVIAIDSKGQLSIPETGNDGQDWEGEIFAMRNGQESVLSLPADSDHEIVITAAGERSVTVYDILVSAETLRSEAGKIYTGKVDAGQYRMTVRAGRSPDPPEGGRFTDTEFNYSPTVVMRNELDATKDSYLSLSSALDLVKWMMAGAFVLLAACLVIHFFHRQRVRKGHAPYSDWYVIVPHIIVIAVSAVMTQYATFYLFSVGKVRAMCAAVTLFYIFVLALRGAVKSREPMHFLIAAFMLVFVHLTALYYNRLPIDSFSVRNMTAFFVMVTLMTTLAVRMFRKEPYRQPVAMGRDILPLVIAVMMVFASGPLCTAAYAEDDVTNHDTADDDVVYYENAEDAVAVLREAMKERRESVTVGVIGSTDEDGLKLVIGNMLDLATQHTGKPDEGDYIDFQYAGYKGEAHTTHSGIEPAVEVKYDFTYYDTAEQEAEVNSKIVEALAALDLEHKTDYEKVVAIHDYICSNTKYDPAKGGEDIKRTAYGALVEGRAVCQGYCVAFYRMLLEAGIDNRIIFGEGVGVDGKTGSHTWNIVDLYGEYYYVDITWDDVIGSRRRYFLIPAGDGFEEDHKAGEEFGEDISAEKYTMAKDVFRGDLMGSISKIRWAAEDMEAAILSQRVE